MTSTKALKANAKSRAKSRMRSSAGTRCVERKRAMALTRDFKELVQKRIVRDPAFADALGEGINTLLAGGAR